MRKHFKRVSLATEEKHKLIHSCPTLELFLDKACEVQTMQEFTVNLSEVDLSDMNRDMNRE